MLGINKIEMSHFPSRLNMGISSTTFKVDEIDDPRWGGFAILEHYLNESIFMTGKYCSDYAIKVGCNENIVKNIADTWGYLDRDTKLKLLKPGFTIEYIENRNSEILSDCIILEFPNVKMEIRKGFMHKDNIETLADLVLKAGIKSISEIKSEKSLAIYIYRVNTKFDGFLKQEYADTPNRNKYDLDNLSYEANKLSQDNPFFIYFYSDKWDSHYSNIDHYE